MGENANLPDEGIYLLRRGAFVGHSPVREAAPRNFENNDVARYFPVRRAVDASLDDVSSDGEGTATAQVLGLECVDKSELKPWAAVEDRVEGLEEAQ